MTSEGSLYKSLREVFFGFVPQNAALFNMSIKENIRYGRLDATEEEIEAACKAASMHDTILNFPTDTTPELESGA